MRPVARAAIALGSAYAAAAAWVVLADRVFHNQVPADRFEIHGL